MKNLFKHGSKERAASRKEPAIYGKYQDIPKWHNYSNRQFPKQEGAPGGREESKKEEMTPLRNSLLIESSLDQKQSFTFSNGAKFFIVPNRHLYQQDGKETNPIVAQVKAVGEGVPSDLIGKYIVVHHNIIFNQEFLVKTENDVRTSVIPWDRWVMGWIGEDGDLRPLNKNVICERIQVPVTTEMDVPDAARKTYDNLMKVLHSGMEDIFGNDIIIVYKLADYEVVYMWNNEIRRQVVITDRDVLGVLLPARNIYFEEAPEMSPADCLSIMRRMGMVFFNSNEQTITLNMRPLRDRVIIKPDAAPEQSASGFVVPGSADIKVLKGTVIAVGQGEYAIDKDTKLAILLPMELKAGETVYYGKNSGTKVEVDGEQYLVCFERECLLTP